MPILIPDSDNVVLSTGTISNQAVITLRDVGIGSGEDTPEITGNFVRGSVLVPVHYGYSEINQARDYISIEVYSAANVWLARRIYSDTAKGRRYIFETSARNYTTVTNFGDGCETAVLWGADEGVSFVNTYGRTARIVLRRGSSVINLHFQINSERFVRVSRMNMYLDAAKQAVQNLWNDLN
jgi:hypothetical protein